MRLTLCSQQASSGESIAVERQQQHRQGQTTVASESAKTETPRPGRVESEQTKPTRHNRVDVAARDTRAESTVVTRSQSLQRKRSQDSSTDLVERSEDQHEANDPSVESCCSTFEQPKAVATQSVCVDATIATVRRARSSATHAAYDLLTQTARRLSTTHKSVEDFVAQRQAVVRFVRDAIADAVDLQKERADRHGRKNNNNYEVGDMVLLSTKNLSSEAVSNLGANKLLPRYIGPFTVVERHGPAYTLDIPKRMQLHPTFYVGRLKPYPRHHHDAGASSSSAHSSRRTLGNGDGTNQSPDPMNGLSSTDRPTCAPTPHEVERSRAAGHQVGSAPCAEASGRARSPVDTRSSRHPFPPPPPPLVGRDGQERWIVERLVGHRQTNRSRQYLVRWLGFPKEFDSWEPRQVLVEDVPDLVEDYETQHSLVD